MYIFSLHVYNVADADAASPDTQNDFLFYFFFGGNFNYVGYVGAAVCVAEQDSKGVIEYYPAFSHIPLHMQPNVVFFLFRSLFQGMRCDDKVYLFVVFYYSASTTADAST